MLRAVGSALLAAPPCETVVVCMRRCALLLRVPPFANTAVWPPPLCRVADWFAQMNNKMGGDLKKIQVGA